MRVYTCLLCNEQHTTPSDMGRLPQRCPACRANPHRMKAHRCTICGRQWPINKFTNRRHWRHCADCISKAGAEYFRSPQHRVWRESFPVVQRRAKVQREYRQRPDVQERDRAYRQRAEVKAKRRAYDKQRPHRNTRYNVDRMRDKLIELHNGLRRARIDVRLGRLELEGE